MPEAMQVKNGKAFEYALGSEFERHFSQFGPVEIIEDDHYATCKRDFCDQTEVSQKAFLHASSMPLDMFQKMEPGLSCQAYDGDKLYIRFMPDSAGQLGDVRDIVFFRKSKRGKVSWDIGISAKNNHEAVKHPRVSPLINFGTDWDLGNPSSDAYMDSVKNVFEWVLAQKEAGKATWRDIGDDKVSMVYVPLLDAFKTEMTSLFSVSPNGTAERLIKYLIGVKPFYKVIKHDRFNAVVVKSFNFIDGLSKKYANTKPIYIPEVIPMPTRLVEIRQKDNTHDTLSMIMDGGWQVDFRFHNAETQLTNSIKLDVQLKGNPPVLFTQHLF